MAIKGEFLSPLAGLSLYCVLYTHDSRHGLHSARPLQGLGTMRIRRDASAVLSGCLPRLADDARVDAFACGVERQFVDRAGGVGDAAQGLPGRVGRLVQDVEA